MTPTELRRIRRHRLNPHANIWQRLGAVWAIDARYAVPGERYARNLGWGGPDLDARYGSSTSPNTNDPTLLPAASRRYAWIENPGGVPANWIQLSGISRPADASEDLRTEAQIPLVDGFPQRTANILHYHEWNAANVMRFILSMSDGTFPGTNVDLSVVTAATGCGIGDMLQARSTWDPATDTHTVYVRRPGLDLASDVGWIEVGSAVYAGKELNTANSPPRFGLGDSNRSFNGRWQRARRSNNGALVFDVDIDSCPSDDATSFTCSTGQTVTFVRSTSGRILETVKDLPVWLYGTDDYHTVIHDGRLSFPTNAPRSLVVVARQWTFVGAAQLLSNKAGAGSAGTGWGIRNGLGSPTLALLETSDGSGPVFAQSGARIAGEMICHVATVAAGGAADMSIDGVATVGTAQGDTAAGPMRLAANGVAAAGTTPYASAAIAAAGIVPYTITAEQVAAIITDIGA